MNSREVHVSAADGRSSPELLLLGGIELRGVEAETANSLLAHPKVVAFLACLALSPARRFQRRDRLAALLWPELDQEHARASLRKIVQTVRAALGPDALVARGDEELALADGALRCDVVEFTAAADGGQIAAALELYSGELMPGFHVPGCAELAYWLDQERAVVGERAAAAAWALACRLEDEQNLTEAGRWARRAVRYTGADERVLRRAVQMLQRLGDRTGALRMCDEFVQRMRQTLEAEPSAETAALILSLKGASS